MAETTLETLQVVIDARSKPLRDELAKMQREMTRATNQVTQKCSKIQSAFSKIGKFMAGLAIGTTITKLTTSATSIARSVEASIQQLNMLLNENAQAFMRWGKQNALAINMSQADFLKYGAVYSNLLSSFIGSTSGVAKHTTDLLKASSIIASATGRSMEDVMDRIRSGLLGSTEAIEDLGINVNVAMLESSEAFKRFAGDKSWNQLSFQTQQQIRLFAILEQTTNKFGDSVLKNTNSSLAQLCAIIKDIVLNIGNALMPVFNAILPPIISFANAIRTVTSYLATFMSLLFGKKVTDNGFGKIGKDASSASKSIGGVNNALDSAGKQAKKTAKELQGSLAGFDELNVISSADTGGSGGSTGGSAGGTDLGDFSFGEDIAPDTSKIEESVDRVKAKLDEFTDFLKTKKDVIVSTLAGIGTGFLVFETIKNWDKIKLGIAGLIAPLKTVGASFSVLFGSVAEGSGIMTGLQAVFGPAALVATAIGTITAALVYLYQTSEEFRKRVGEAVDALVGILKNFYDSCIKPIAETLKEFYDTVLVPLGKLLSDVFLTVIDLVASILLELWTNVLAPIVDFIVGVLGIAIQAICDIFESWIPVIKDVIDKLMEFWNDTAKPIVEFIKDVFIAIFEEAGNIIKDVADFILEAFQGVADFFVNALSPNIEDAWNYICDIFNKAWEYIKEVWEPVKEWFSQKWQDIKDVFANTGEWFGNIFTDAWNKVCDAFSSVKDFFGGVWTNIKDSFGNISGWFRDQFTEAWTAVKNVFSTGGKIFDGIKDGILNGLKEVVNAIIRGINKVVAIPFNGINSALRSIRDTSILGIKPFSWIKTISVPTIPQLAQGGIVSSATQAIVGEAGTEAVIPLKRNTQGIEMIANKLLENMPVSTGGGTYIIQLVLEDGTVLAKKIIKDIKDYEIMTGKPAF